MNEKKFQELLSKLHIPMNRSYTDVYELLDAKLSEYLDRQDDASLALVEDIQDALDFAEKKKKEVGGGIALAGDEESGTDSVDMDGLRDASHKHADATGDAQTNTSNVAGTGTGATNSGKLWFYSLTGAQNIDNMFFQACDDLKYDQYDHADSIFEMILQAEPQNASAYLGKVLAEHQLREPKEIGSAIDKSLDVDVNLRRASDHGNDAQKKYIADALEERENAIKYVEAERLSQNKRDKASQEKAFNLFKSLGAYRDAQRRSEVCKERVEELTQRLQKEKESKRKENMVLAEKAKELVKERYEIRGKMVSFDYKENLKIYSYLPETSRGVFECILDLDRIATAIWERAAAPISVPNILSIDLYFKPKEEVEKEVINHIRNGYGFVLELLIELLDLEKFIFRGGITEAEKDFLLDINVRMIEDNMLSTLRNFRREVETLERVQSSDSAWEAARRKAMINRRIKEEYTSDIYKIRDYIDQHEKKFNNAIKELKKVIENIPIVEPEYVEESVKEQSIQEKQDNQKQENVQIVQKSQLSETGSEQKQGFFKKLMKDIFG